MQPVHKVLIVYNNFKNQILQIVLRIRVHTVTHAS
jgi:hypothetical protein